jgi:hypothetical protein
LSTEPNGTAVPDESFRELHRLLVADLTTRLGTGRASAEMLQVARRVLKDQGPMGLASTDEEQQRIRHLYSVFVQRLSEAVHAEAPSAAILAEARHFLDTNGAKKNLQASADKATALTLLADQRLPFKH